VKRPEKRVEEKKPSPPDTRPRSGRLAVATAHAEAREPHDANGEGAAPEELDQVVSMLGDMDIDVDAVEDAPLAEESRVGDEAGESLPLELRRLQVDSCLKPWGSQRSRSP